MAIKMVNWCCNVPGCSSTLLKKKNREKYPELQGVTFHAFPSQKNRKLRRQWIRMLRRDPGWEPNKYSRVCSLHFPRGKGPSEDHPVPVLFKYNNWKLPVFSRSRIYIEKFERWQEWPEIF